MSRRRRQRRQRGTCVRCNLSDIQRIGGYCASCLDIIRKERRARTGARLLSKAKESTVERDGQTFTVKILPPKRKNH